jgi:hypothetical protein
MVKEEDSLLKIQNRLNSISSGKVAFSDLKKVDQGQYSFTVGIKDKKVGELFNLDKNNVKKLIKSYDVNPNSLFGKYASRRTKETINKIKLAGLKDIDEAKKNNKDLNKVFDTVDSVNSNLEIAASLDQRYRDKLDKTNLDLRRDTPDSQGALDLYKRSEDEYYKTGIYGSTLDILSNFSATGFHNEVADLEIKQFYDAWAQDTNFQSVIVKIFQNLFKYSVVYILPGLGAYEPNANNVSSLPGQEPNSKTREKAKQLISKYFADRGHLVSDKHIEAAITRAAQQENASVSNIPLSYTILDPKQVQILSTGFFGGETLVLKSSALKGIADLEERKQEGKISKKENEILKLIPSKIRAAAKNAEDYIDKDNLISTIYLRKNDFEIYAKPKGSRAFDSFDYKEELIKADYATLDGIFNQILKVTVGDKDNPVTDLSVLEAMAEAFDTPQKAFTIVWHHALNIEKITNPEIGEILGLKKYEPVNLDITAALGITRALIDGHTITNAAGILSSKALQSEIDAAREIVSNWVYAEYRNIAIQAGFSTFPVVRWKNTKITTDSDAVTKATWMQLADRQIASRETVQFAIGLDPKSELEKMRAEHQILINEGIGIQGSPFQQTNVTDGRPKSQPTMPKAPVNPAKTVTRQTKPPAASQQPVSRASLDDMTKEELIDYIFNNMENDA